MEIIRIMAVKYTFTVLSIVFCVAAKKDISNSETEMKRAQMRYF